MSQETNLLMDEYNKRFGFLDKMIERYAIPEPNIAHNWGQEIRQFFKESLDRKDSEVEELHSFKREAAQTVLELRRELDEARETISKLKGGLCRCGHHKIDHSDCRFCESYCLQCDCENYRKKPERKKP